MRGGRAEGFRDFSCFGGRKSSCKSFSSKFHSFLFFMPGERRALDPDNLAVCSLGYVHMQENFMDLTASCLRSMKIKIPFKIHLPGYFSHTRPSVRFVFLTLEKILLLRRGKKCFQIHFAKFSISYIAQR